MKKCNDEAGLADLKMLDSNFKFEIHTKFIPLITLVNTDLLFMIKITNFDQM